MKGLGARQRSMRPQLQRDPHDFLGLKVAGLVVFLKALGERIVMIIMIIAIIMILIIIIMMLAIMRLRKYIYILYLDIYT